MIVTQYLRQKIYSLLNGSVTVNSSTVPVYENEGVDTAPIQIVIGDYSDADTGTTRNFGSQAQQVIQIISMQPTAARKRVDEVGAQVFSILNPTPTSNTLSGTDFDVNIQGAPAITHLTEDMASGNKAVRLILSYNFLITNKTV